MAEILAFLRDDRAASPVIGVILVVAIAVILAAVASFFFLDVGQSPNTTPSVDFAVSFDPSAPGGTGNGQVTIEHAGGQTVDNKNTLSLVISSPAASGTYDWLANDSDGMVMSGESVVVGDGQSKMGYSDPQDGDKIEVIWTGPDGDKSNILFEKTLSG